MGTKREHLAPETAAAYESHRSLLLAALGRLAKQGYPVRLSESMDMIHDFFVEAWPGLEHRYDPAKGSFTTYLFGAFMRFARPRIIRSLRWENSLLPPDDLAFAADNPMGVVESVSENHDLKAIRNAVATLEPLERQILEARVAAGRSEREVAQHFGLTRYQIRAASAKALARLAGALDEPGVLDPKDYKLANILWTSHRTVEEAAALLGTTQKQVRLRRQRILRILAACISGESAYLRKEGN